MMKNLWLFFIALIMISSCTPSAPYEIRSPCVSIEEYHHTNGITPCVRRPVNEGYAIA
ncbi:DUF2706 domain-containing protein [Rickettsiaceae bacterium]|nr:DUF2706 domain-containing protein [Rickettsiaceae bacterium]